MIKVAIIGTGGMARFHVIRLREIPGVEVVAGCDIDAARVAAFCAEHNIAAAFTDAARLLRECDAEAVVVATPDATHCELSLQALVAGRHVLCEKPLATNAADAQRMAAAALASGKIHMVNLSYRNSSAWQQLLTIVGAGELGTIRHVQAHYLQSWLTATDWGDWRTSPTWLWRLSAAHGSHGALGDIGVHILDFVSQPVGRVSRVQCSLTTFDKAPGQRIGEYFLDANDSARIWLDFENGAVASVNVTRFATGHRNSLFLSIHGDKAGVRIDLDKAADVLEISRLDAEGKNTPWQPLTCAPTPNVWARFIQGIRTGVQDQPDFVRGAEVQAILDACERSHQSQSVVQI